MLHLTLLFVSGSVVYVAIDDTLLKKRGNKVYGASFFRDAVLSSQTRTVTRWGLNFVVLAVVIEHPLHPHQFFAIPIFTRLFLTQEWCDSLGVTYASPSELAVDMLQLLQTRGSKGKFWRVCVDGGYTNSILFSLACDNLSITGVLRSDASLQKPLNTRAKKGIGRPPIYGESYRKPIDMVFDRRFKTQEVTFFSYQGLSKTQRVIELFGTYREVANTLTLRFVLAPPLSPHHQPLLLVTSDLHCPLSDCLAARVSRWSIEVLFREAKQEFGIEKSHIWSELSVQRMAPFGFWLMGMVKVWYLLCHHRLPLVRIDMPWDSTVERLSFARMLSSLRYCLYSHLLQPHVSHGDPIFDSFGLPDDLQKRKDWILRNFCGC